ncbi:7682_t:CDS:2 [Acaulospora colombiana]|uniref:7682_t:CDS:1 n=1 Tax=Acaulospora colombiana TaxID=27376 RepID=A0ACA9NP40_9GLOM|nr:7682_t:CDS:2 [Acaulospora colombiana]
MGRPPRKQQKIQSQSETSASSTYEKYKELKRKYKELSRKNEELNERYDRAMRKAKKCRSERDNVSYILERIADSFAEPGSKRLKLNTSDATAVDDARNSYINNSKHDSLVKKVKIVNDVQQKSKKTSSAKSIKRRQGRSIVRSMKAHHVDKDENGNYILPVEFIVQADDAPDQPIVASSATGAWTPVIKQANSIRNRKHSNAASGPDYFGLSQPTIRKMIQELPNSEKCENYIFQEFELHNPSNNGRGKPNRKRASKKYDTRDSSHVLKVLR